MSELPEVLSKRERPNFQTSVETRLLYARLRKLEIGEIVTYRELTQIISQDVQNEARGALTSARRMALRDDGIICDAIHNVGIKRLSDSEAVQSSTQTFARVRRLAHRGAERLVTTNPDALSQEDRIRRNASLSAFAVVKLMGKPKTLDKIAAANTAAGELPIARTLELFRGPKPV